nr:unnamed protein product [Callosobruchus analis]
MDNTWVEGGKRKLYHQPPTLLVDDTDETTMTPSPAGCQRVKRNKGGEASTSATAGAVAARVDDSSNNDAVVVNLEDDFDFPIDK